MQMAQQERKFLNYYINSMSNIKSCLICGKTNFVKRDGKVRDNPQLEILECPNCGLVFLSSFDHITEHFYEDSKMHNEGSSIDINAWQKASAVDDKRRFETYSEMIANKDILDFGCGAGGFLNLSKNIAKIKQIQRYPLSNHLYWLVKGKPGGHIEWNFLNNSDLAKSYENTLSSLGKCDTIVGYLFLNT